MATRPQYYDGPLGAIAASAFATSCRVTSVWAETIGAGTVWFDVFDKASAPVVGDSPIYSFRLMANNDIFLPIPNIIGAPGRPFANGLALGWSNVAGTFVPIGSAGSSRFWASALVTT
jgi:hypothetical protein